MMRHQRPASFGSKMRTGYAQGGVANTNQDNQYAGIDPSADDTVKGDTAANWTPEAYQAWLQKQQQGYAVGGMVRQNFRRGGGVPSDPEQKAAEGWGLSADERKALMLKHQDYVNTHPVPYDPSYDDYDPRLGTSVTHGTNQALGGAGSNPSSPASVRNLADTIGAGAGYARGGAVARIGYADGGEVIDESAGLDLAREQERRAGEMAARRAEEQAAERQQQEEARRSPRTLADDTAAAQPDVATPREERITGPSDLPVALSAAPQAPPPVENPVKDALAHAHRMYGLDVPLESITAGSSAGQLAAGALRRTAGYAAGALERGAGTAGFGSDIASPAVSGEAMREKLAAYVRGDHAVPPQVLDQHLQQTAATNPQASPAEVAVKAVTDEKLDPDQKAGLLGGMSQRYQLHNAMAQGALAHGDVASAMRLAQESHNHVPDGQNLSFRQEGDRIIATVDPLGNRPPVSYAMTMQQFHDYLVGPGTLFDHVVVNGVQKNLEIASRGAAPAGTTVGAARGQPATGYSQVDMAQARQNLERATAPAEATAPVDTVGGVGYRQEQPAQRSANGDTIYADGSVLTATGEMIPAARARDMGIKPGTEAGNIEPPGTYKEERTMLRSLPKTGTREVNRPATGVFGDPRRYNPAEEPAGRGSIQARVAAATNSSRVDELGNFLTPDTAAPGGMPKQAIERYGAGKDDLRIDPRGFATVPREEIERQQLDYAAKTGYKPWDPKPVVDRNTGEVLFGRQDKYGRWPEQQAAEGARPWEPWMGRGGYTPNPQYRGEGPGYITPPSPNATGPGTFTDTRGDYGEKGRAVTVPIDRTPGSILRAPAGREQTTPPPLAGDNSVQARAARLTGTRGGKEYQAAVDHYEALDQKYEELASKERTGENTAQTRQDIANLQAASRQKVAETQVAGRQGVAETQVAGRQTLQEQRDRAHAERQQNWINFRQDNTAQQIAQRVLTAREQLAVKMYDTYIASGQTPPPEATAAAQKLIAAVNVAGYQAPALPHAEIGAATSQAAGRSASGLATPVPGQAAPAAPAATTQAPVRVQSIDEARKLPSGTAIILPDGSPGKVP